MGVKRGVNKGEPAAKKTGAREAPGGKSAGKILDSAEKLFARDGFDAVSMNDVAEEARTSKANIFHHFGSKRDLYIAVVRRCMSDCAEDMSQVSESGAGFEETIRALARIHLERLFKRERATKLIRRGLMEGGAQMGRELAEKVLGENFGRLVNVIMAGKEAGRVRPDADPAMAALLLVTANLFFFESRNVFRHFPSVDFGDDRGKFSEKLVDILLNGVMKRGSAPKRKANGA